MRALMVVLLAGCGGYGGSAPADAPPPPPAPEAPAKIKIDGKIIPVNKLEMTPKMVKQAAIELMDEDLLEAFTRELEVDFAISEPGLGRFRVNVFHQRGNVAMVLRYITSELPTLDELGMPAQLKELVIWDVCLSCNMDVFQSWKSSWIWLHN